VFFPTAAIYPGQIDPYNILTEARNSCVELEISKFRLFTTAKIICSGIE
jgi:hypothetical protein